MTKRVQIDVFKNISKVVGYRTCIISVSYSYFSYQTFQWQTQLYTLHLVRPKYSTLIVKFALAQEMREILASGRLTKKLK